MTTLQQYLSKTPAQQRNVKKDDLHNIIAQLSAQGNAANNGPSNADIMKEIITLRADINEVLDLKQQVSDIRDELNTVYGVLNHQLRFLETLDSKERGKNIIITDLKEDNGTPLEKQVNAIGYTNVILDESDEENIGLTINGERLSVKRLGVLRDNHDPNRPRAVLVQVPNKNVRNDIIANASSLKNNPTFARIYVKKDVHPAIRKEEGRLRKKLYDEKNNPLNVRKVLEYDRVNRTLLCDGNIIDRFRPNFLLVHKTKNR